MTRYEISDGMLFVVQRCDTSVVFVVIGTLQEQGEKRIRGRIHECECTPDDAQSGHPVKEFPASEPTEQKGCKFRLLP